MPDQYSGDSPRREPFDSRREPFDSDIDLRQARRQGLNRRGRGDTTVPAAIAAAARYRVGEQWLAPSDAFPASTLAITLPGCALIGVLMVLITDVRSSQRLVRPFLGVGVLGGFTTFSFYTFDTQRLAADGHAAAAPTYLGVGLASSQGVWS